MSKKINRRTFIKKSTAIGASSLVGASLLPGMGRKDGIDMAVVKGEDYVAGTIKAVELLGGMKRFVPRGARVALLPNSQRSNPGVFTKPEIVRAVIKMCRQAGAAEVNCLTWLPEQTWADTGLKAAVEEAGAKLVLVNRKDESLFKPVTVEKGKILKEARIMKAFFQNDVFINMPIAKDHAGNKFTCTLKNLMGLNSPKNNRTFHKQDWATNPHSIAFLDQCIADLNTVIKPALCLVDATELITTNGPFGPGKLIKPQKVVAGTDRVAIDSYCCTLWGLKSRDIIMINRAAAHGLGQVNLKKVNIKEMVLKT
jgi:uncharacterized protein (DUF362 family)